jgi:hypothetical protein
VRDVDREDGGAGGQVLLLVDLEVPGLIAIVSTSRRAALPIVRTPSMAVGLSPNS